MTDAGKRQNQAQQLSFNFREKQVFGGQQIQMDCTPSCSFVRVPNPRGTEDKDPNVIWKNTVAASEK